MDLLVWDYWMWDDKGEYIYKYAHSMDDHPDAEFLWETEWDDHWPRRSFWTPEQAAALSFGRSPDKVPWNDIKDMDGSSEFAAHFGDLRERIIQAQQNGILPSAIPAVMYVQWAEANGAPFPPALARDVEAYHKSILEGAEPYATLQDVIREQREEIDRLKADGQIHPRTRNNMLRVILAVAKDKYYHPKPGAAKRISDALARNGSSLDEETILKYLEQGSDLE